MDKNNPRLRFLESFGFNHDPFETPVAEQELTRVQEIFYLYYSHPASQKDHLSILRASQHTFIFGVPGSGKSTLRLMLDADCRTVLDGSLPITYLLGEDVERPLSGQEHGERLARAFAIDLTLAILEQFNPLNPPPTLEQIHSLQQQVQVGGRPLGRLLQKILSKIRGEEEVNPTWGLSKDWHMIGKAPIKYISSSPQLEQLITALLTEPAPSPAPAGWETFWRGLETARLWHFTRFFLLLDGVDARRREADEMTALIAPLLETLPQMEAQQVWGKFFLPPELKEKIHPILRNYYPKGLNTPPLSSIMMKWDENALRRLLMQRLRAARPASGMPYTGLDNLATAGLNLDAKVIRAAEGSPRRLLSIVSDLIDVHVRRAPDSPFLSQEDWEAYHQEEK
ncbi:MAG: ATP-binding cassette domain-containing protein [Candidatus Villigracilaceae bacterium]